MIQRIRRSSLALVVCSMLVIAGAPATAGEYMNTDTPSSPPMVDLIFLRPIGLGVTAVSAVFFVPAALITVLTRPTELDKPYEAFLKRPVRYTFLDPLGEH